MKNIIRYIFLTAQRDSLFLGVAVSIILGCQFAFFLGGTAIVEQMETSLVYAAGICRVVLVIGLVIFIAFHIRRSFENREIDLMLVRPVSRTSFIIAYWLGFSIIALLLVLFTSIIIYAWSFFTFNYTPMQNLEGFLVWSFSLLLEALVVVALAMASALILRSTVIAVLFCLGFYVLSRVAGFVLLLATKPWAKEVSDYTFLTISKLVPRLDFFGKTEWIVYGLKNSYDLKLFVLQAVIYCGLMLSIAVIDFKRKEF